MGRPGQVGDDQPQLPIEGRTGELGVGCPAQRTGERGGAIRFVELSEAIPAHRKRSYKSALNRTRRLLGNGLADIRAEPKEILAQLDRRSPAMAGMSRPSYCGW